jgi:hypothetical protein
MRVTRTRIYQTDDMCLAADQPALLPAIRVGGQFDRDSGRYPDV